MIQIFLQKFRIPTIQAEEILQMIENYNFPVFNTNWENIETVGDIKREIRTHALKNVVRMGAKFEVRENGLYVEDIFCPTIHHINQVLVHFPHTMNELKDMIKKDERPYYN